MPNNITMVQELKHLYATAMAAEHYTTREGILQLGMAIAVLVMRMERDVETSQALTVLDSFLKKEFK